MKACASEWTRCLMKLVTDANALFSCLIKDGTSRHLWLNPALQLYTPHFLLDELTLHATEIKEKTSGEPDEMLFLSKKLLRLVTVVSEEKLAPFMPAAATLSKDRKDWPYLACALKENAPIWSNDKEFKKQNRVTVYSTSELLQKINEL